MKRHDVFYNNKQSLTPSFLFSTGQTGQVDRSTCTEISLIHRRWKKIVKVQLGIDVINYLWFFHNLW